MKQQQKSVTVSVDFRQHNHGTNEKSKKRFNLFAVYCEKDKYVKFVFEGSRREILEYLLEQFNYLSVDNKVLEAISRQFFSPFNFMSEYNWYASNLHYFDLENGLCVAFARIDGTTVKFYAVCLK